MPSASATMMSPGETTTPPTATGVADDAGAVLEGAGGGGAAGEDGQALRGEGFGVADGAVDDGAEDAFGDHDLADEVADEGAAEVALAVDDEDVAGLGVVEGAVDGEVVPGAGQDRQGGADEPGVAGEAADAAVHDQQPVEHVADVGGGRLRELVEQIAVEAGPGLGEGEAVGGGGDEHRCPRIRWKVVDRAPPGVPGGGVRVSGGGHVHGVEVVVGYVPGECLADAGESRRARPRAGTPRSGRRRAG